MTGLKGRAERRRLGGIVVLHAVEAHAFAKEHERATRALIARGLAALKGYEFVVDYDLRRHDHGRVYMVPSDTLVGLDMARAMGVKGEDDLFGGVVPHGFIATKVISHPLVERGAPAPDGWSHDFGGWVAETALRGCSVFTTEDAVTAARRLLAHGPVRLKPARATGGRGQTVVSNMAALDAALAPMDADELARDGLVLEEDLAEVTTRSVGQVRVAGLVASYCGTQQLTPDNDGADVYGGSDLLVVRGGFEALLALDLSAEARHAVGQARTFDAAAKRAFPGLFASRRNYDVAQGLDAAGHWRSGVLEQSWRIGGASGAEIAALLAFRADPALQAVRASTVERYGACEPPPAPATVLFHGTDPSVGTITKYALVEPYADPR
jgi:hypothetical protein